MPRESILLASDFSLAYSATVTYRAGQIVSYQGSAWRATAPVQNQAPGSAGAPWELLVAKGETGIQGPPGPTDHDNLSNVRPADPASSDATRNKHTSNADAQKLPLQGEKDALAGTTGTPSSTNKFVTNSDTRLGTGGTASDASLTVKGVSKLSVSPVTATNPLAVGDNDPRMTNARAPTDASVTSAKMATGYAGIIICASTTRPANPITGQVIYETDTSNVMKNVGTPAAPNWQNAATAGTPTSRQIATGAGLVGGGDLSADRTLSLRAYAHFEANANGVATTLPTSSWTTITLPAETTDADGVYSTATSRFTAPRAGVYDFVGLVHMGANALAAGVILIAALAKNADPTYTLYLGITHPGGTQQITAGGSAGMQLAQGDTMELRAWHNKGSSASNSGSGATNYFHGMFRGD